MINFRNLYILFLILIATLVLFPLSGMQNDIKILEINREIEDIFFEIESYRFDESYQRIDSLMLRCNELDYLIGENELLILKIQQAIALGEEEVLYTWLDDYNQKIKQSITYGLQNKELYYKFLKSSLEIVFEGFEYQKESIIQLLEVAQRNKTFITQAYILYRIWINVNDDEKTTYAMRLEELFDEHSELKNSWAYIAFKNLSGIEYATVDFNWEKAHECFLEVQKASKKLNLDKFKLISDYRVYVSGIAQKEAQSESETQEALALLEKLKNLNIELYLEEILSYGTILIEMDDYETADKYLTEYVQTTEDHFRKIQKYLVNAFNSSIVQVHTDGTMEEFKAEYLVEAYDKLSLVKLHLNGIEQSIIYQKKTIELHKVLDWNGRIVTGNILLALAYNIIGDVGKEREAINNAIRYLGRVTNSDCEDGDCRIQYAFDIVDYFLENGVFRENPTQFRKTIRLLNESLEESKQVENYQFQYESLVGLAVSYYMAGKEPEKQYDYFIQADSLLKDNDLEPLRNWNFIFIGMLSDKHEFEKILDITTGDFEYYLKTGDYRRAYSSGVIQAYIYSYLQDYDKKVLETISEWINILQTKEIDDILGVEIRIFEARLIVVHSNKAGNYDEALHQVDEYLEIKEEIIGTGKEDLISEYIDWGMWLLNIASFAGDSTSFFSLRPLVQPLQWEYNANIESDAWFILFVDDQKGPFNEELYFKYLNRILAYPLNKNRIEEKIGYGNVLINVYGNWNESIKVYEEALQEAKQLNESELELEILTELGIRYGYNRQFELAKRRLFQALDLAKHLGDDQKVEVIFVSLFEFVANKEDKAYYNLSRDYLTHSKKVDSHLGQIQALEILVKYLSYHQQVDSLKQYMLEGFRIKDFVEKSEVIGSKTRYLNYLATCFNAINNDLTGEIVSQVLEYVGGDTMQPLEIKEIANQMVYLKDFNFGTIDDMEKNKYPFVYYNAWQASITLRQYWDYVYLGTEEFNEMLDFLLNADIKNKEWGYLNAFWEINKRIKTLEDYSIAKPYKGFGFRYDTFDDRLIVSGVIPNSPAWEVLLPGDKIIFDDGYELSRESAKTFMSTKVRESEGGDASFRIVRNETDTLDLALRAGTVQPNPYSEEPGEEVLDLSNRFFEISDTLLTSAANIRSYTGFADTYREFLIAYPWRYSYTHDNTWMSSEQIIGLLDRYEQISTYDLVNESIEHKKNLEDNPLLVAEYHKYSDRINRIQVAMHSINLSSNEIEQLRISRENAYSELEYFESYSLEHDYKNTVLHEFSFFENMDMLSEFDVIIRFCSSEYLNNSSFMWIKDQSQMNYYYTSTEQEIEKGVKIVNQILSYSAIDTALNKRLETSLIDLFTQINGNKNAPIFDDDFKNKEVNVLVIPEGSMNLFPMELLPIRFESDTTKYYYYGEYANITYAPSLSSYVQFTKREDEKKKKKKALLVSANPETESTTNYVDNLLALRSDLGNIEFVDDEIKAISRIISKRRFRKKRATPIVLNSSSVSEKQIKSLDLSEYSYIHFASHGVHDDVNPKYSGILLGREENDSEDGILQAHEIFPLNLNAELVALSSCFSGFGEIDPNEGNLGIYRSFLIAGAKSVIVSLWPVEDESTALLFTKFYEYHQRGKSKAEALRLAKMYLKNVTEFSHPFFWAPFVLIGES